MPKVFLEFLTLFISSCKGGVVLLSVYRNLFITTLILMQYALILLLSDARPKFCAYHIFICWCNFISISISFLCKLTTT